MWSLCEPVETSLAIKTKINYHDSLSDFHSSVCTDDYQKLLANDKKKSPPNHQYSPPKKHGQVRQMFFFVHLWIFAQQMLDYLYVHVWMISYCDHFLECILTHKEKEGNYIYNANYSISWLSHHWYFSWDTAKDDWKLKKLQTFKELVAILKEVWF